MMWVRVRAILGSPFQPVDDKWFPCPWSSSKQVHAYRPHCQPSWEPAQCTSRLRATKHDQVKLPTLEEDYPTLQQAHSLRTLSWKPLDTSRHTVLRLQEGCAQLKTAPGRRTRGHLTVPRFSLPQEEMQNFTLATLKAKA